MSYGMRQEKPEQVRRKWTASGAPSSRYMKAVNGQNNLQSFERERQTMYKKLSKAQIAREYTPGRVVALLAAAKQNLKALSGPARLESWMLE